MIKTAANIIVVIAMLLIFIPVTASAATKEVKLVNMHEIESDEVSVVEDGITDSYGKTYSNNVLLFYAKPEAFITYDLNGAYESFNATIVCSTDTGSEAKMDVGIFADGELIYDLKGYTRQKAAETVELNVSGVGKLSIKTAHLEGYDCQLYFVDSFFTKSDKKSAYPNRSSLSDLVIIDNDWSEISNRLFVDVFGNVHNGRVQLNGKNDGYMLFNLDQKFTTLTGCIVCGNDTGNEASMNIKFYLDDEEVYSEKNITRVTPQIDFQLDVTNAKVLKITASYNEGYDTYLNVADSILKVHEHALSEWMVEKEATCTEEGEKVQKCTECGEVVNTEKIPALGHSPDGKWEVTKEATCDEEGEKVQRCTVCGQVAKSQKIEKLHHTPSDEWQTVREATCSQEGLMQKICEVCGEAVEEEVIKKLDHVYGEWETVDGNIWKNPIVKERTCINCGEIERQESNSTAWVKPLVIILLIVIFSGLAIILVQMRNNRLPLRLRRTKNLFPKEHSNETSKDYRITFIHPTSGETLDATLNPELAAYLVIAALVLENFIAAPPEQYGLQINGVTVTGSQTLESAGIKDGGKVKICKVRKKKGS